MLRSFVDVYTCPADDPLTYIVATGGNPGLGANASNPNIAAMAIIDVCDYLPNRFVNVDEVTTVATVVTYGQFFSGVPNIGVAATNVSAGYASWGQNYLAIVNPTTGNAPGPAYDGSEAFPFNKRLRATRRARR